MVAIILEAFRGQCLFEMISGLYDPFILTRAVRAGYLSCMHQIGSTHAALVMLVGHCYLHYYLPCRAPFLKCKELWAEEISLKHISILDDHAVAVCLLWQSNSFLLSLSPILLWTEPPPQWCRGTFIPSIFDPKLVEAIRADAGVQGLAPGK